MTALNEDQARLFVAEKALELGRGGTSHLSKLTGMSRVTITSGLNELRGGRKLREAGVGRVRARDQPIHDGRGDGGVVEDVAPLGKCGIRGDESRAFLAMAGGDDLIKQVRRLLPPRPDIPAH